MLPCSIERGSGALKLSPHAAAPVKSSTLLGRRSDWDGDTVVLSDPSRLWSAETERPAQTRRHRNAFPSVAPAFASQRRSRTWRARSASLSPSPGSGVSCVSENPTSWIGGVFPNTMPRCRTHQLSPASTGRPQNMPRRRGFGSPSIQRHPRKSASVSAPLLPPPTSSPMRRALLLGTSVAMFAFRATLGSVIRAGSQQLGRRDDSDIAGR